jgi:hypothetical protein
LERCARDGSLGRQGAPTGTVILILCKVGALVSPVIEPDTANAVFCDTDALLLTLSVHHHHLSLQDTD